MKKIFTVVAVCALFWSKAQTVNPATDTVRWMYGQVKNLSNGEAISLGGSITSFGKNGFRWTQNGMAAEYEIQSSSSTSNWIDAGAGGKIVARSRCNGVSGTVTIERVGNAITIELDFSQAGKLTPHVLLTVNSYHKI
jgi:hypothetical protein